MKRKFKQLWSTIPPVWTQRTISCHIKWTHWIQKRPRHVTWEIQS